MSETSPSIDLYKGCGGGVAERARPAPGGTTRDGSKRLSARQARFGAASGVATAIAAVGALAGLVLVIGEFTTVAAVDVAGGRCEVITEADPDLADRCALSGFERHGGAFLLLGLVAVAMAWGAGLAGSRAAAVALIAVGSIVLLWALAFDLPEAGETGAIGPRYQGAEGEARAGLWLELIGGALAVAAGALRLGRARSPAA
jgi:hypothetical protein